MLRKAESVDTLSCVSGLQTRNNLHRSPLLTSHLKITKDFPANSRKNNPDYEEIALPATSRLQNNHNKTKINCDLCGSTEASVKCDRCSGQAFCFPCDSMYHRHPKRTAHARKAIDRHHSNMVPLKPPLPPKVAEGPTSPPPQPPPRKNKRSGMLNRFGTMEQAPTGRIIRRSSVGGEVLCQRNTQSAATSNGIEGGNKPSMVMNPSMVNRPLPPTPGNSKGLIPTANSVESLSRDHLTHTNSHASGPVAFSQVSVPQQNQFSPKPPLSGLPSGFSPYISPSQPVTHSRKLSLQQLPSSREENKASFGDTPPGTIPWDTQPPKLPQKLRSQSISEEQWNRTVLGQAQNAVGNSGNRAASEMGDIQHLNRGYTMGYGGRPCIPSKGMTSSASVSNLNAMHDRTNSFHQMNMVPYDPNMMWMNCPHCLPHHGFHQPSMNNNGMKRAASNISMNLSSIPSETSGYPWSMPTHVHPHLPFYPGYYPPCQQQMPHLSMRSSATSIPDSIHSIGKEYFSQTASQRSSRSSQKPITSFMKIGREGRSSRHHSRTRSIASNESLSSENSDENLKTVQSKPTRGCLSWQCHHCTYINPGFTDICNMCSKPSGVLDDKTISRNGRERKEKYSRRNNKDVKETRLSDYENKGNQSGRNFRDHRLRQPSSSRSLGGWNGRNNIPKRSHASDSPSLSDSHSEEEKFKIEKQLRSLNITHVGRGGINEVKSSNLHQRTREKYRKPEGKYKFRNRSKSASVRTKTNEKLTVGLALSLTSSDSDDGRSPFNASYSSDEMEERRISSLEETIMASILMKQQSKINLSIESGKYESSDDEWAAVPKTQNESSNFLRKEKTNSIENNEMNNIAHEIFGKSNSIRPSCVETSTSMASTAGHVDAVTTTQVTNNQLITVPNITECLSDVKSLTSLAIEIDESIDYIDASSDSESPVFEENINLKLAEVCNNSDVTQISNENFSKVPNLMPMNKLGEIKQNGNYYPSQSKNLKLSITEKNYHNGQLITVPPVGPITHRMSPTSISSSDIQFYSPPGSPIQSVTGRYCDSIDKGFDTDIYGDEDLVTALESLDSTEDLSSENTIHSSLEQLSFTDEAFESPLNEDEASPVPQFHSSNMPGTRNLTLTKSLSDKAISANMKIQISAQVANTEVEKDTTNRLLTVKEIVDQKIQHKMKQQGFQIVEYFRAAEQKGYNPEDVSIAMTLCEEVNPVEWLDENWNAMIDTVQTLATNYGIEREPNDVGKISATEAKNCLRLHKGNIWAAVTECVEQRQIKYKEIDRKGNFSSQDIVNALEIAGGNVADALIRLVKDNPISKLFNKIWNPSQGVEKSTLEDRIEKKTTNPPSLIAHIDEDKQVLSGETKLKKNSEKSTHSVSTDQIQENKQLITGALKIKNKNGKDTHSVPAGRIHENKKIISGSPKIINKNEKDNHSVPVDRIHENKKIISEALKIINKNEKDTHSVPAGRIHENNKIISESPKIINKNEKDTHAGKPVNEDEGMIGEVIEGAQPTTDDRPLKQEDTEHIEAVAISEEHREVTEEIKLVQDPIIVDGDKVRQHGGIVTVQKATKIVALAISKAMARECAVKDDVSLDSQSSIPSNCASPVSETEEMSSSNASNLGKELEDSLDETTEELSEPKEEADEEERENKHIIRKSSIPLAVESFVGPIFIPVKSNAHEHTKELRRPVEMSLNALHTGNIQKQSVKSAVRSRIKNIEVSSKSTTAVENDLKLPINEQLYETKSSDIVQAGPSKVNVALQLLPLNDESGTDSGTNSDAEEHRITLLKSKNTSNLKHSVDNVLSDKNIPVNEAPSEFTKAADIFINATTSDRQKHTSGGSTMESPELSDDDVEENDKIGRSSISSEDVLEKPQHIDECKQDDFSPTSEPNRMNNSEETCKGVPKIVIENAISEEDNVELTTEEKQKLEQLHFDRTVRRLLAEGHAETYEKAELAAHLLALSFDEGDSVSAAAECASIYSAMRYLRQECELCAERYPMGKMVSMLHCIHRCCYQCATNYFTFQIKAKNIRELRCPFCNEPDLEGNEEVTMEYFNNLDILLKGIIDEETHELFQRKVRDLSLMKDPNFRWCNKCSSGFIANPRARKLICPDCKQVTCAQCRQVWEFQHEGITCEEFLNWKADNDPESQAQGVARHLAENGITCPKCRFTYALAKGGCMHFTCTECKFEFCSGCSEPFKQGAKCTVGPYCERLGLHAHHPRNCLFYLRDKDPQQLQELLSEHNITFDTENPYDNVKDITVLCRVLEQKETLSGLKDDACGRAVLKGQAGLCNLHYVEYLVEMINNNALDPVTIFDEADLRVCLRRNGKTVPVRRWESEKLYRNKLIKLIKEQLPLPN